MSSPAANVTLEKLVAVCTKNGDKNVFEYKTKKFVWEPSKRVHPDGAITGTIFRIQEDGMFRQCNSLRIEGDGTLSRGPSWMQKAVGQEVSAEADKPDSDPDPVQAEPVPAPVQAEPEDAPVNTL